MSSRRIPKNLVFRTVKYRSSIDGLGPLYADLIYRPDGRPKPLTAVLHGFHCTRGHVTPDGVALARRGLFCVMPDMRGHGDSAGQHDCGALQICDIVDALGHAARRVPGEIDRRNVNAVGYSGGGANVLSLMTKFPDLLNAGASFFGVSDYEIWYRTNGRPDCNRTMERAIGGTPEQVPERYAARSSLRAIANNSHTRLHLFWDREETACPPLLNEWFLAAAQRLGHDNVRAFVSQPGDKSRWIHGYRADHPGLAAADDLFVPAFLASPRPKPRPDKGELDVCGYVVTSRFAVWLGDGKSGHVRIRYNLAGRRPVVECVGGLALMEF
ncbi:MAG: alpha/beta fold hydrolase [Lentisphaerae bacterium]|nr:alpha/beta fold hydrolase [Lentisphaerota bacterium]